MNLGGFEIRIDRRADLDELPIATELIEERSQIAENQRTAPVSCTMRPPNIVITLRIPSHLLDAAP